MPPHLTHFKKEVLFMGIFDSLKNMTNQAVKSNVSKAVSGAVNNAMHKSKTFVFADYPKNADVTYLEVKVVKAPDYIKNLSYTPQKVEYILEKK